MKAPEIWTKSGCGGRIALSLAALIAVFLALIAIIPSPDEPDTNIAPLSAPLESEDTTADPTAEPSDAPEPTDRPTLAPAPTREPTVPADTAVPPTAVPPTAVPPTAAPVQPTEPPPPPPPPPADTSGCVDINSASLDDMRRIIHLDEVRAPAAIQARPYGRVEDLTRVSGIGKVRMGEIVAQGLACVR